MTDDKFYLDGIQYATTLQWELYRDNASRFLCHFMNQTVQREGANETESRRFLQGARDAVATGESRLTTKGIDEALEYYEISLDKK